MSRLPVANMRRNSLNIELIARQSTGWQEARCVGAQNIQMLTDDRDPKPTGANMKVSLSPSLPVH